MTGKQQASNQFSGSGVVEQPPVILIIHQDQDIIDICRQVLEPHGFIIEVALNGTEGIQTAYRNIPDVILAGSGVPDLNGYQICRLLKNDSVMRKLPILLLADMAQKMERFWGMKAGADDYLQRDELGAKLLRKVQVVLEIYDRTGSDEKNLLRADHEKNPFNIRTRLNQILDTSLVESMLMVEFRSLTDLIHDTSLMNYMLFSLLESILEYDAAAIFFNDDSKAPRLLTIHVPEGRKQTQANIDAMTSQFFAHFKSRDLNPALLEMTETDVIGLLDDTVHPEPYTGFHLKEMHIEGRLIGAVAFYAEQKVDYSRIFPVHLVEDEIRLLMKLRHLYSQAEMLAITDILTGLYNQQHFMHVLQREFKSALRYDQEMTMALVGIDLFKRINDEYGHACGDELLRHVAALAIGSFRNVDILARFGGKYIAIVMPSTPSAPAHLALERFQKKVAELPCLWQQTPYKITVSIGMVTTHIDIKAVGDFLHLAEGALHLARERGMNQIEISNA